MTAEALLGRHAILDAGAEIGSDKRTSVAEQIVQLAIELYTLHRTQTDEPYAIRRGAPPVATMLRGSRDSLRAELARAYREGYGRTPRASALADAITTLHGYALDAERKPVHLRVAEHDGGVVLDLGREDGAVASVTAHGWEIVHHSPVVFRRSPPSGELPIPNRGGSIDELRKIIRVTDDTWPLLLGWLVAAYLPLIPHPVLLLGGEHGTGKTTTARTLVSLIDHSPAPVRAEPRDVEGWSVTASGSWVVAVDNVSVIPAWWSDAICRAVTGDGLVRRALYTDSDISVLTYRRVIALTSIDAGALRGDLGDRIVLADLEPIPAAARRSELDIGRELQAARARVLGAVLDLLAGVLRRLEHVHLTEMPRMADFARVLAAMDQVIGTDALACYLKQRVRIAADVIDGDGVAAAVLAIGDWAGTMGELFTRITPDRLPRGWPNSARGLGARLRRAIPVLRQAGVVVRIGERTRAGIPVDIAAGDQAGKRTRSTQVHGIEEAVAAPVRTHVDNDVHLSAEVQAADAPRGVGGVLGVPPSATPITPPGEDSEVL